MSHAITAQNHVRSLTSFGLFGLFIILILSFTPKAFAGFLEFPLDCTYGKECFIQKYADATSGKEYKDYTCGTLTNDTHKGTDIRLNDYDMLAKGVNVLAAASGKIIDARNYMPDVNAALIDPKTVWNRGYGNLILIQHADGYKTLYAHLALNSLKFKKGDDVQAGDIIAKVGMSGLTDYPHLHFEVLRKNTRIDPFSASPIEKSCGLETEASLWKVTLPYKPTHLIRIGLFDKKLGRQALEYKMYENPRLSIKAKGLILNAYVAGVRAGDTYQVKLSQKGKSKAFFDKTGYYPKDKAFGIIAGGKGDIGKDWPKGIYVGELIYKRAVEDKMIVLFTETTEVHIN